MKSTDMQMYCAWCLSTMVNVSIDITHTQPRTFVKVPLKFLVQNSNYKKSS
jgi:hypothetical protein